MVRQYITVLAFTLVAGSAWADAPETTLIIGDSLSSTGGFGAGLARSLSKKGPGDQACLYSVSGSRMSQWASDVFKSNRYDATMSNYVNGTLQHKEDIPGGKRGSSLPNGGWALPELLAHPSEHSCGTRKFTSLVVQLGSNSNAKSDPRKLIESMIKMAHAQGIKSVHFVLPPRSKSDAQKFFAFNKLATDFLATPKLKEDFKGMSIDGYDSNRLSPIDPADFRDEDHFWGPNQRGSASERLWLKDVEQFLKINNVPEVRRARAVEPQRSGH